MSSQNEKSFFDSKTIIAVVLVGVLFFGWQKYLEYKYPDFYTKKAPATATASDATNSPNSAAPLGATTPTESAALKPVAVADSKVLPETKIAFQNDRLTFEVSSKGMGLHNLIVRSYTDREKKPVQMGASETGGLFEVGLLGRTEKLDFQIEKISETALKGIARIGTMSVEQDLTFHQETSSWSSAVRVLKPAADFKGLTVTLPEKKHKGGGTSFLMPSMEYQEFVVKHQGTIDHVNASSESEDVRQDFTQVALVSLGSQYFTSAFVDQSDITPEVQVFAPAKGELRAVIAYKPAQLKDQMNFQWKTYSGPKSLTDLQKVDVALVDVVNFGFFASIGKILLVVLQWFNGYVGNWGFSIILLTILVRFLVLPFNITSYKSMKKMQKIQPMLQSIRERYKSDPTAMNRETMALMKEQKVNPLGGCLPMLLQMPVFFALYQVLGQSIELYQAPFVLWIHDLSIKDPFFVLPVLMGITMFIQQKITPTTMDPAQAKILQWMPIIFSVFTLSLPAGLTLYIFVSTLFGVLQQQVFMRDSKPAVTAVTVSAK
ncbi:MAG: membrane protein insertase YidC [Bdellovibrio sp.]